MRCLVVLLALAAHGCTLYFGDSDSDDPGPFPDACCWPDAGWTPQPDARPPIAACAPATSASCSCNGGATGVAVPDSEGGELCLCGSPYTQMRNGMIGRWQGDGNAPAGWVWFNPAPVEPRFHADGLYGSDCRRPECVALYYGNDGDSPQRTYGLTDLRDDGYGEGWIRIQFDGSGTFTTGTLSDVELSADALTLRFTFWPSWLGTIGPIVYDLNRCDT